VISLIHLCYQTFLVTVVAIIYTMTILTMVPISLPVGGLTNHRKEPQVHKGANLFKKQGFQQQVIIT